MFWISGKEPILNFASEKVTILGSRCRTVSVAYRCTAALSAMYIHFPLYWIVLLQRDALCSRDDSASLLQSMTDVKRGQLHSTNSTNVTKIVIYTANFGSYDPIPASDDDIADVPDGFRAFYFVDDRTFRENRKPLQKWKEHGWEIIPYNLLPGNAVMKATRLTSRELKFTPPDWLLHASSDWLIYHDSRVFLSLPKLLPFLKQREHMALVLHDYCYDFYKDCCGEGNGFKCFEHDMDLLMNRFPRRIRKSRDNMIEWKATVEKRVEAKNLTLPHYFDLHLIMRNLKHKQLNQVIDAGKKAFNKLHELQRDQVVFPVYLHDSKVTEVDAVSSATLSRVLQFRVNGHHKRFN